jgi:hypothetical protein
MKNGCLEDFDVVAAKVDTVLNRGFPQLLRAQARFFDKSNTIFCALNASVAQMDALLQQQQQQQSGGAGVLVPVVCPAGHKSSASRQRRGRRCTTRLWARANSKTTR